MPIYAMDDKGNNYSLNYFLSYAKCSDIILYV